ncbi:hypothetical protein [Flavicella sediminum]|nr:hypothetical protein [Flavicella sediminum]
MSHFKRVQVSPLQTVFVCNPKGEVEIVKIIASPIQQYRNMIYNAYASTF